MQCLSLTGRGMGLKYQSSRWQIFNRSKINSDYVENKSNQYLVAQWWRKWTTLIVLNITPDRPLIFLPISLKIEMLFRTCIQFLSFHGLWAKRIVDRFYDLGGKLRVFLSFGGFESCYRAKVGNCPNNDNRTIPL